MTRVAVTIASSNLYHRYDKIAPLVAQAAETGLLPHSRVSCCSVPSAQRLWHMNVPCKAHRQLPETPEAYGRRALNWPEAGKPPPLAQPMLPRKRSIWARNRLLRSRSDEGARRRLGAGGSATPIGSWRQSIAEGPTLEVPPSIWFLSVHRRTGIPRSRSQLNFYEDQHSNSNKVWGLGDKGVAVTPRKPAWCAIASNSSAV